MDKEYSITQQIQIDKGKSEKIPGIGAISPFCTVEQIRNYRQLFKNEVFKISIHKNDIEFLAKNFNKIPNLEYLKNLKTLLFIKDYIKLIDILGIEKAKVIFDYKNFLPINTDIAFIKKCLKCKNFDISFLDYNLEDLTHLSKRELEKVFEYFSKNKKDLSVENTKAISKIILRLSKDNRLDILDAIDINKSKIFGILLEKGYNPLNIALYKIDENIAHLVPSVSEKVSIKDVEKYAPFILKFKDDLKEENLNNIFKFILSVKPSNSYLDKIESSVKNLTIEETLLLKDMATSIKYASSKAKININKVLEKIDFIFDKKYTEEQKKEIARNFGTQITKDKFIVDYINPSFDSFQISLLRDNMLDGKNIKNALNPKFSTKHMIHIIYFNEKGITFKDDNDYDTKYTSYKNNDYITFSNLYENLFGTSEFDKEIINNILTLSDINKKYNLEIDIQSKCRDTFYISALSYAITQCKTFKKDINMLKGKTLKEIQEITREIIKDSIREER